MTPSKLQRKSIMLWKIDLTIFLCFSLKLRDRPLRGHSFSTYTNFSKKKKKTGRNFSFLGNFYVRTKWMIHFYFRYYCDFLQFHILIIILKGNSFDGKFASFFIWNKNMNRIVKSLIMFIRWNSKVEVNWWPNICF